MVKLNIEIDIEQGSLHLMNEVAEIEGRSRSDFVRHVIEEYLSNLVINTCPAHGDFTGKFNTCPVCRWDPIDAVPSEQEANVIDVDGKWSNIWKKRRVKNEVFMKELKKKQGCIPRIEHHLVACPRCGSFVEQGDIMVHGSGCIFCVG